MNNDELQLGEYHPSADDAMKWFKEQELLNFDKMAMLTEAIYSTALSGNRSAEVMAGTLDRLREGKPVSDRYLLGLCWFLRDSIDNQSKND